MDTKPTPKLRVIPDTCFLLIACAEQSRGDSMSELDIDYNNVTNGNNPNKLRASLIGMLLDKTVIVPEIVRLELQGLASGAEMRNKSTQDKRPKLSDKNIQNIRSLVSTLENRTTMILPTYQDVLLQKSIWDKIQRDPESKDIWKRKFEEHASKVNLAAENVVKDLPEKWLQADQEIKELRKLELSRPSKQISLKLAEAEKVLRETLPQLVPDFEILLISLKTNSQIISRDGDFPAMWKALPEEIRNQNPKSIPQFFQRINDNSQEPKSMTELNNVVERRVRPFVPRPKPRDNGPNM